MTYGPNPWRQTNWDWRAAGNFICGGAGGGLIALTVLAGTQGAALTALLLAGVALVGLGLLCVWLEIGRPLRALNVLFNPRTSWMTREAFVASMLMPVALGAATGWAWLQWPAAALALAFVYCQSRILQAAKGIPAWREAWIVPMIVFTGLAEGAGLWLAAQSTQALDQPLLLVLAAIPLLARALAWPVYRQHLARAAAPAALQALDGAGRWLQRAGSIAPLVLLALAASGAVSAALGAPLLVLAGLLAAGSGAWFKFTLLVRAAFNQGFALAHLPVRGVPR